MDLNVADNNKKNPPIPITEKERLVLLESQINNIKTNEWGDISFELTKILDFLEKIVQFYSKKGVTHDLETWFRSLGDNPIEFNDHSENGIIRLLLNGAKPTKCLFHNTKDEILSAEILLEVKNEDGGKDDNGKFLPHTYQQLSINGSAAYIALFGMKFDCIRGGCTRQLLDV